MAHIQGDANAEYFNDITNLFITVDPKKTLLGRAYGMLFVTKILT